MCIRDSDKAAYNRATGILRREMQAYRRRCWELAVAQAGDGSDESSPYRILSALVGKRRRPRIPAAVSYTHLDVYKRQIVKNVSKLDKAYENSPTSYRLVRVHMLTFVGTLRLHSRVAQRLPCTVWKLKI